MFAWRLANSTFKLYASHTGDVAYQTGWSNDGYSGWRNVLTNNNIGSYAWTSSNDGSGSGLDADLLDGIQGASFLRSDTADTFTGTLTMGTQQALVANDYGRGVFGLYSATRYQHVWSMGTAYKTSDDGTSYGNMYGLTWTHTNIGTGANQSIAGLSHQLQLRENGVLKCAFGTGIWTAHNITSGGQGLLFGTSNDGSGSGLDADLLDGQQGSYYYAASNPSGYQTTSGSVAQSNYVSGSAFATTGSPGSVLEYQQASGQSDTRLSPTTDWYNSIRMGHGNPYNYYSNTIAMRMTGGGSGTMFTQLIHNNVPQGWRTQWDSGNDGSGSGLDADLLDGLDSTSFIRSDTGTIPAARMPTVLPTSGNYVWSNSTTAGNYPGPGIQCSFVNAANGWPEYGSVLHVGARGGGDAGGDFQIFAGHGAANGGNYLRFRNADNSASPTDAWTEWKTIWGSGNDGSGSGLDADLLDGIDSGSFARRDAANTFTSANYFLSNRNTTSDSPPLQAYSTGNTGAIMSFHRAGYYAVNMGLDSDNVFRIGGWSAAANRFQMDMSGNLTMAGNITAYSDIRLKENIKVIPDALSKVQQLRGVTFTRNDVEDLEKRHTGVIAQEVEAVLPEAVSEDNDGIKNVAYGNMVGLLIEAIKEQQTQINELIAQVKSLKEK